MLGEQYVELRGFHHYVLARSPHVLPRWLERGFVRVPSGHLLAAITLAFDFSAPLSRYVEVWRRLFPQTPLPAGPGSEGVVFGLVRAARGSVPMLYVLERRIERGFQYETPERSASALPLRTASEHYVVIEAVRDTESGEPVPGLRLELLIADGEVRTTQTDANGVARVERIQAGRVVIRVLDVDGARWRPVDGAPAARSTSQVRARRHVVVEGDCLSRIAHQQGLEGWQRIWEHPQNEALRQHRKSPHVLHPGDELVVPDIEIHEIARPTDATHRIALRASNLVPLQLHLRTAGESSCGEVAWSLFDPDDRSVAVAQGYSDPQGRLRALVPVTCTTLLLVTEEPEMAWLLRLGGLTDVRERRDRDSAPLVRGLQGRLLGLGFDCGPMDGIHGPRTSAALAAFQEQVMSRSGTKGELDAETTDRLVREYEV